MKCVHGYDSECPEPLNYANACALLRKERAENKRLRDRDGETWVTLEAAGLLDEALGLLYGWWHYAVMSSVARTTLAEETKLFVQRAVDSNEQIKANFVSRIERGGW